MSIMSVQELQEWIGEKKRTILEQQRKARRSSSPYEREIVELRIIELEMEIGAIRSQISKQSKQSKRGR